MNISHQIIQGNVFSDGRGFLSFINNFSLRRIIRFYEIIPKNTFIIRAWQAHKKESKWFYCTQSSFKLNLIKLNSFENPSDILPFFSYELHPNRPKIVFVPFGYANGLQALVDGSKLMVFSDLDLDASKHYNFRFKINKWATKW